MIKQDIKKKVKEIYEVLPKLNDRRCGYGTCGEFARAVAEGEAPCDGCITGGYAVSSKVCSIMGEKISDEKKVLPGYYSNKTVGFGSGFGRGRGYRNRYYTVSFTGNRRYQSGLPGQSGLAAGYGYHSAMYQNQKVDANKGRAALKQQASSIREQLKNIEERIKQLEKNKKA